MPADPSRRDRIGILGGTFDPIHMGHLVAAQAVHENLDLDRTLLIPSGSPPHKEGEVVAPATLRMRMVRAAVEEDPRFEVSDLELRREGPSFTVDTLRALVRENGPAETFLILGVDQWAGFGRWREPWEILAMATVVVMARSGEDAASVDPQLPSPEHSGGSIRMHPVTVPRIDLSSSEIRARIGTGRSVRYMVPESVHRILEASKLYL